MKRQYCSPKQRKKLLQFQMKPGLIMLIIFANYSKSTIILHRLSIEKNSEDMAASICSSSFFLLSHSTFEHVSIATL